MLRFKVYKLTMECFYWCQAWNYSVWVRGYALYLEERVECFNALKYDVDKDQSICSLNSILVYFLPFKLQLIQYPFYHFLDLIHFITNLQKEEHFYQAT